MLFPAFVGEAVLAGVAAAFAAGEVLFAIGELALFTFAVFDVLAVFAVELFDVVFAELPHAEKSNVNKARLNAEMVFIGSMFNVVSCFEVI